MKTFYYLAGLPRTGSTLLTSLLYQNPKIHTEGASALCGTLWANVNELENNHHLKATKRTPDSVISKIPENYYADVKREVVIDKCFTWTLDGNIQTLQKYIGKPKFIIMERPLESIIHSFMKLMKKDGNGMFQYDIDNNVSLNLSLREQRRQAVLAKNGVLDTALQAYNTAKKHPDQTMFHYVSYEKLVTKPKETLNGIYDFLEMERYEHNFNEIKNTNRELDSIWGLPSMHKVKSKIK